MDTWSRGAAEQENGSAGTRKGSAGMGFAGKGGVVVGCGRSVRDPLSREGKLAAGAAGTIAARAAEKFAALAACGTTAARFAAGAALAGFAAIMRCAPGAGIPG